MRVAVTGGAGFIGRHTVTELERRGHEAVVVDRAHGVDLLTADLVEAFDGCDEIIHLAGVLGTSELFDEVQTAIAVNLGGSARELDAVSKTGAGYVGITMPDCWPSVYQATKLAAVRLSAAYVDRFDIKVMHVRAFNAYGPDQANGPGHPQKIVPTFAARSWSGLPIPIWGEGDQTVDLVHVDHIAERLVTAVEYQYEQNDLFTNLQTWDAGSGVEMSVLEVAHKVMDITGTHLVEFLPMRYGEVPHTKLHAERGCDIWDEKLFREAVEAYR
jgi:UDP-glucose 4-epimerase